MTEGLDKPEKHTARPLRLVGRFLRRTWQGLVVLLVAVALGVAAYLSPGLVQADVRLDEGNVYAVKRDSDLVGTVNAQIDQLSNATTVGDTQMTVLQHEDTVLLHMPQSSLLTRYNVARNTVGSTTELPNDAVVQLVGGKLLVYTRENGRAWSGSIDEVLAFDFKKEKADFEVGEFGIATLTTSGDVIGLDPTRSVLVRQGEGGEETVDLPFTLEPNGAFSLSAVGDSAVVLDRTSGRIWVEGMQKAFDLSGASSAVLMAPAPSALGGEDGAKAIFANQAGLNKVTSDGIRSLSGRVDATPVQPVQVGECVYGAFYDGSGTGQFVRECRGQETQRAEVPEVTSDGSALSFQVNRGTVALNDLENGTVWLVDDAMKMIRPEDWQRVVLVKEDENAELENNDTNVLPDRKKDNRDPIAEDDALSARANRSTILNVLDNDTDPDGDVLTISTKSNVTGATLQPIRGGAGLQITVDANMQGKVLSFDYTVSDGRGGSATATATVRVLPDDLKAANDKPFKFKRATPLKVQLGQKSITKRVLLDWRDPDGDPLILKDAVLDPAHDDIVAFTPDGQITYTDVGKTTGRKVINLVVSDGVSEAQGELEVIVSEDPVPPVAFGDFVTTTVDLPVKVSPLENDVATRPTLTEVLPPDNCPECTLTKDFREGTFTFTAPKAGVYYLVYTVVDGPASNGLVRIDVRAPGTQSPPIPALDVALLPPGGSVMVDPLLNDTDPDGDVLVIQTYDTVPGLEVVMERRHLMTIKAKHTLDGPVRFSYVVSDGKHIAHGTIVVIPTQSGGTSRPRAINDEVVVRAGTTANVDVLKNDSSPIGLDLELVELSENPFKERAWIDGKRVRVAVPPGSPEGNSTISYAVRDTDGNIASARVQVTIVSADAPNLAPVPPQVIDRVLSGTTTRIPIPLDGIDPNGDAVRLLGLGSGPQFGRVLSVGDAYLTYEAYKDSQGTDAFSYTVVDAHGQTATGEVRIGVAPANKTNTPPIGVIDELRVRPGRQVQIAALANDFDVDGDTLLYASDEPVTMDDDIPAKVVDKSEIVMTAPQEPGTYIGRYDLQDSRGEVGNGNLRLIVEEEAALLPPVTRDDGLAVSSLIDKDWVDLDPLANDYDPDGPREQLTIEVPGYGAPEDQSARVTEEGKVSIPVLDTLQQIRYVAIDGDGNRTNGLITVPGRQDSVPVLKDPNTTITVDAGQPYTIEINKLIVGTEGREVYLPSGADLWRTNGTLKASGNAKLEYVGDIRYAGPASIVFKVTDKVPEGDTSAKSAIISIPVTVLPATNQAGGDDESDKTMQNAPPTLNVAAPSLRVGPEEGEQRLDLTRLFTDPEGDAIFLKDGLQKVSGDGTIQWRTEGNVLVASAPLKAVAGTAIQLSGVMMDAADGAAPFQVSVTVTSSTRPTVSVTDDTNLKGVAGVPIPVAPLANDQSNLLTDKSLTLVSVRAISGGGTVKMNNDGQTVTVVPEAGWHGAFTASYTVNDATDDPNRRVDGLIRVQVIDKPGKPSTPFEGIPGDGQVSVKYLPGGDGGSTISQRIAVATAPGQSPRNGTCGAGSCTVTGLQNGVPWTVSVTEVNEVGPSEPSPQSAPIIPDANPLAPGKPVVAFGDKELTATWTHDPKYASAFGGSPIKEYLVTLYDASKNPIGKPQSVPGTTLSYTWKNLTNGTPYLFSVKAVNSNPTRRLESPDSELSNPEYPSGPPSGNVVPAVQVTESDVGGGFTVSFDKSGVADNGAAIENYTIIPFTPSGNRPDRAVTIAGGNTGVATATITGMGQDPTRFIVMAKNRSGEKQVGTTPSWIVAYAKPKITEAKAEPLNGGLKITAKVNNPNTAPTKLQYRLGGDWVTLPQNGVIGNLTNGQLYDVTLRATLENMTSPEVVLADKMPRTEVPKQPDFGNFTTILPEDATAEASTGTWTSTGGWDPKKYRYCVDANQGRDCFGYGGEFTSDRTVALFPGERNSAYWRYDDGRTVETGKREFDVNAVSEPQYKSSTRTLKFTIPYVQTGSCTVVLDGSITRQAPSSNGTISFNEKVEVPAPTPPSPPPTPLPPVEASTISVVCTVNGSDHTYPVK